MFFSVLCLLAVQYVSQAWTDHTTRVRPRGRCHAFGSFAQNADASYAHGHGDAGGVPLNQHAARLASGPRVDASHATTLVFLVRPTNEIARTTLAGTPTSHIHLWNLRNHVNATCVELALIILPSKAHNMGLSSSIRTSVAMNSERQTDKASVYVKTIVRCTERVRVCQDNHSLY